MTELVLDPGGPNELTLDENVLLSDNPTRTHTGVSDFRASVAYDRRIDDYAQRQDRFNLKINGDVKFTGFIVGTSHSEGSATTNISGDGIAKKLEETRPDYDSLGGSLTYSSIALEDAIDDYWDRTPFDNHSVTPQSTEQVANNQTVQSADTDSEWNSLLSIANDTPLIVQNDNLELQQTCFTTEAENFDNDNNGSVNTGQSDASNEQDATINATAGSFVEYNFTTNYDIPASDFEAAIRYKAEGSGPGSPTVGVYLDNTKVADDFFLAQSNHGWTVEDSGSAGFNLSGTISAGSHTLKLQVDQEATNPFVIVVDVVAPRDGRYTYTDDNTLDINNFLSGPELFPNSEQITLPDETVSFNISESQVSSTWNDTTNNQAISTSNDGGSSYETTNNSDSATHSYSTVGRTAKTRFTLSRFGSRTTATPTSGFNGQTIDSFTHSVDGDNTAVIDELELTRDHFSNLKELHSYGGFLWTIEHDGGSISNMTVTSYQEGDETRSKPAGFDDPIDKNPELAGGNYYNSIYLQGALDSNGDRPTAEVKDQTAISNDNREISPGVLRDPKVTTESGAVFRARSLLESAQDNSEFVGSITVQPSIVHPGYARPVALDGQGNDQNKTVEEVTLTEGRNNVQAQFVFSLPEDISEEISQLKTEQRGIGDNV